MGPHTCTALLLIATAALAPSAAAQSNRVAIAEELHGDLQVIGAGVGWAEISCLSGCDPAAYESEQRVTFLLKPPGQRARRLSRVDLRSLAGGSNSEFRMVRFSASATRLVRILRARAATATSRGRAHGSTPVPCGEACAGCSRARMPTPASPWRGTCLPSIRRPAVVAEAELRSCRWPAGAHAECQQATAMRERSRSQAISSRPRSTTASHRARSETHRGVWRSGIGAPAARSAPWRWSRSTRSSGWTSKPTAPWSSERSGATATAGNARGR